MRTTLRRGINTVGWLFAISASVLAVRFTIEAIEDWFPDSSTAARGPRRLRKGPDPVATTSSTASAASPKPAPSAAVLLPMLTVRHGDQRSEVYVNGALLGFTPFAGDVACSPGEVIKVQIVPAKGAVIEREPACHPKLIQVSE